MALVAAQACAQMYAPDQQIPESAPAPTEKSMPTVKGHTLGETLQQFVGETGAATQKRFQSCDRVLYSKRVPAVCLPYIIVARTGSGGFVCQIPMSSPYVDDDPCGDFAGIVTFENNKLVILRLELDGNSWSVAVSDVTAKYGPPTENRVDTMQNGFGAKFDYHVALWAKPKFVIEVREDDNPLSNTHMRRETLVEFTESEYLLKQATKIHPKSVLE
jgi:hypothetical protein